jgi:type VI secretion system protein ImpH
MQPKKRRHEPSVIQRLFAAPQKFGFFQAVRVLELWFKRNGATDGEVLSRYVRFRNTVSLSFPPSEIEAIDVAPAPESAGQNASGAAGSCLPERIALTTPFMGFLGASGALPSHYSERIAAHQLNERDDGPRAFLDIFSTRAVTHFFEAWRKYRLEFKHDLRSKDEFLPLLLSLAGLGHPALQDRMRDRAQADAGLFDESLAHFSPALRQRPMSAHYLQQLLRDYFGVPIQVKQFVGAWYNVPPDQQTALGKNNACLGSIAMVGERVWQRNLRICLRIGPLSRADHERFFPYGAHARSLEKLVRMLCGEGLEYDVELLLRAADVRGSKLGNPGEGLLGWNAFMVTLEETQDRCDVRYRLNAGT